MRNLLPGSNRQKQRLFLRAIKGPSLPTIPSKEMMEKMLELEQINRELPKLEVFPVDDPYCSGAYVLALRDPFTGKRNQETYLLWAALNYLQVSSIPFKVVELTANQKIENRFLIQNASQEAANLDFLQRGGEAAPREEEEEEQEEDDFLDPPGEEEEDPTP